MASRKPSPATTAPDVPVPDILRALGDEHRYQARVLKVLEHQVGLLNQKQQPDYDAMRGVMRYMTQFPDRLHHPKEDLLFEKIVQRDPSARAKVKELLDAHKDIIAKGATLLANIEAGRAAPAKADTLALRKSAHAYIGALRRHMDIEMLHMFPLAQQVLQPADWIEVDRRMKPILDPVFEAEGTNEFNPLREAEKARPGASKPGAMTAGLIEATALIEAAVTLIAGASKSRKDLAQHQREVLKVNMELMRGLMKFLPLDQRFRLTAEMFERNMSMVSGLNQRMNDLWSGAWKSAWAPYEDEGPFAPKLLKLGRRRPADKVAPK